VNGKRYSDPLKRFKGWIFTAIVLTAWSAGLARAQTGAQPGLLSFAEGPAGAPPVPAAPKELDVTKTAEAVKAAIAAKAAAAAKTAAAPKETPAAKPEVNTSPLAGIVDPDVVQASCASCGGGLLRGDSHGDCGPAGCPSIGCNGSHCVPGQTHCCSICDCDTCAGRILCGLYHCICCPERCYEPEYIPAANAAFYVDSARPITQTRLRYDGMFDVGNPDRAEYLMARFGVKTLYDTGAVPIPACQSKPLPGKGPAWIDASADITTFSLYTEAAIGRFSTFVSMPYEHLEPTAAASSPAPVCATSAFGDLTIGTKSLLLDCDLLQFSFQFSTFLPTGNFTKGIGTAHVSLEPAFLMTLKLTPDCYFQAEMAYWIPIAGDPLFSGPVWHNHASFNMVLCRILPDVQLIGTLEMVNMNVKGGNFTSEVLVTTTDGKNTGPVPSSATTGMFSIGPGLRLDVCKRLDAGVGLLFNCTNDHYADEEVRAEIRLRF
jgi:hypothetical protein